MLLGPVGATQRQRFQLVVNGVIGGAIAKERALADALLGRGLVRLEVFRGAMACLALFFFDLLAALTLGMLKVADGSEVGVPALETEQQLPQRAVGDTGAPGFGEGRGAQQGLGLQVGEDLEGDFRRQVDDGVEVQQGIQLIDNGGDGRGAERAQDGVGEVCSGSVAGMAAGKGGGRTTALGLVQVEQPVRQGEREVGVGGHVEAALAARVLGVSLVEAAGADEGGGAERTHVGRRAVRLPSGR